MLKTKIAGGFGAVCAAGALTLTPLAVSASAGVDLVVFEGHTTTLNCNSDSPSPLIDFDDLPVVGGSLAPLDSALNCPDAGASYLALVGGTGNYQFTTTGTGNPVPLFCLGASDVGLDGTPHVSNPCIVNSSGAYRNLVCGTGTAVGSAGGTTIDENDGTLAEQVAYNIIFAGGVGIVIGIPGAPALAGGITSGEDAGDPIAGVVVLQGVGPNPGPGGCVSGFEVLGVAVSGGLN